MTNWEEVSVYVTRFAAASAVAVLSLLGAGPLFALDMETQLKIGEIEYIGYCASCHGASGQGDGPVAEALLTPPSDLTMISKSYSGTFPPGEVYREFNGTNMINPHGDRKMPVWGPRYWEIAVDLAGSVPHDPDAQALVHGRITALVQYIESLQAE